MDPEEERVLYLTRVGREKIIKRGTYDVRNARPITQNHPFYEYKTLEEGEAYLKAAARGEEEDDSPQDFALGPRSEYASGPDSETVADVMASAETENNFSGGGTSVADDVTEANADDLASEILSSNFKVGMSQSEVDDFLKGLLGE